MKGDIGGYRLFLVFLALCLTILVGAACQGGGVEDTRGQVSPPETREEGLTYEEFRESTPPAPRNLQASATAEGVRLDWESALAVQTEHLYSDRVEHYNVWRRAQEETDYTLLGSTSDNSYVDTTAVQGAIYYYAVSAVHEGPVEGERTEEVTPSGVPPEELTYEEVQQGSTPPTPRDLGVSPASEERATEEGVTHPYTLSVVHEGPVEGECGEGRCAEEAAPGEGLTYEEFRETTPPAPRNLRATLAAEGVRLDWEPALAIQTAHLYGDRVEYYNVWRRGQGEHTLLGSTSDNFYVDTTAIPGVTYYYAVSAVHEGPVEGQRTEEVAPSEVPPEELTDELTYEEYQRITPPAPRSLWAACTSEGVHLDWEPAPALQIAPAYSDKVEYYNVWRRAQGEVHYVLLGSTSDDFCVDTAAIQGVIYYYAVSGVHEGPMGLVEGQRTEEVTPPEGPCGELTYEEFRRTMPPAPRSLRATCTLEGARLDWKPALALQITHAYSDKVEYYNVWRRGQGQVGYTLLASTPNSFYVDTTAIQGAIYYYAVSAVHEGSVEGERTGEVTPSDGPCGELTYEEFRRTMPPAPRNLWAAFTEEGVRLDWEPAPVLQIGHAYSDRVEYYNVWRRTVGEVRYTLLASTSDNFYVDTTAIQGVIYYYAVSAVHEGSVEGERTGEVTPFQELTYEEFLQMRPRIPGSTE